MSETVGSPEPEPKNIHELFAEARSRIKAEDKNVEMAKLAQLEAVAAYTVIVREALKDQEIIFSGQLYLHAVQGVPEEELIHGWQSYDNQTAKVNNVFIGKGPFGDIETDVYLTLVGGEDSGRQILVQLERIEWSIMEDSKE